MTTSTSTTQAQAQADAGDRAQTDGGPEFHSSTPGGIALRPEIDPEVLAVLASAVDQAWPRPRLAVIEEPDKVPAWRFSGRWWTRPAVSRRSRPWA